MSVHHVDIYHCQKCGKVISCDHDHDVPTCCGVQMEAAVPNITYQDDCDDVGSTEDVIKKSHAP
jgi:hypothetical protein